jgi:hypothetical protein
VKVDDVTLFRGTEILNLEDSISKAGIMTGSQVEVAIKLKVLKIKFTAVCRDPEIKLDFDVKHSTNLHEIKDNILGRIAAGAIQVFLCLLIFNTILDMNMNLNFIDEGGRHDPLPWSHGPEPQQFGCRGWDS